MNKYHQSSRTLRLHWFKSAPFCGQGAKKSKKYVASIIPSWALQDDELRAEGASLAREGLKFPTMASKPLKKTEWSP